MKARSANSAAIVIALMAAGCAQDGSLTANNLNTSSIDQSAAKSMAKSDPACLTLASQIEALNRDGTADKVSKAALKKYKLKTEDLAKADELNKANTEFQTRCSNYPPRPVVATATTPSTSTTATTTTTPAKKEAAKAKTQPPVPAPKPVASAAVPPPVAPAAAPQTTVNPEPAPAPAPTQP